MAVSNPGTPSLAGDYQNILQQLDKAGTIAQQQGQLKSGVANAVAAPLENATGQVLKIAEDRSSNIFKASLEDQLNQHKAQYTAATEGRSATTQDDIDQFWKENKLDDTHKPKINGTVYLSQDDITNMTSNAQRVANVEHLATQLESTGKPEDKVKAGVLRIVGRDKNADASVLAKIAGLVKPTLRTSPTDGLLHVFDGTTNEDLGPVPGSNTSGGTNGTPQAKDFPSLRKVDLKQANDLEAAGKAAKTDPQLKKNASQIDALNDIKKAIESNNPTQLTNIRARLAQESGGVPGGRFSSTLLQSEGFDPSLASQLDQWVEKKGFGDLTQHNKDLLTKQVNDQIAIAKGNLSRNLKDKIDSTNVIAPYASDDLRHATIAGNYDRYLQEPKTVKAAVDVHDPKTLAAVKFLQANNKNVNTKNVSLVLGDPKTYDISPYLEK